jgi:hypothetical protein
MRYKLEPHIATPANPRYISLIDIDGDIIAEIASGGTITYNQPVSYGGTEWNLIDGVARNFNEFFDILQDNVNKEVLKVIWMDKLKSGLEKMNNNHPTPGCTELLEKYNEINF